MVKNFIKMCHETSTQYTQIMGVECLFLYLGFCNLLNGFQCFDYVKSYFVSRSLQRSDQLNMRREERSWFNDINH